MGTGDAHIAASKNRLIQAALGGAVSAGSVRGAVFPSSRGPLTVQTPSGPAPMPAACATAPRRGGTRSSVDASADGDWSPPGRVRSAAPPAPASPWTGSAISRLRPAPPRSARPRRGQPLAAHAPSRREHRGVGPDKANQGDQFGHVSLEAAQSVAACGVHGARRPRSCRRMKSRDPINTMPAVRAVTKANTAAVIR
jgi:hypothetical protein